MTKTCLSERQLRPLARAIEQREAELRRRIAEDHERADEELTAEPANGTGDLVDQAFAGIQGGVDCKRLDSLLAEVRDLAAARERLENGIFGSCVDCGEPIDRARLRVSPAAARCALCQERYEYTRAIVRY